MSLPKPIQTRFVRRWVWIPISNSNIHASLWNDLHSTYSNEDINDFKGKISQMQAKKINLTQNIDSHLNIVSKSGHIDINHCCIECKFSRFRVDTFPEGDRLCTGKQTESQKVRSLGGNDETSATCIQSSMQLRSRNFTIFFIQLCNVLLFLICPQYTIYYVM